MYKVIKFFRDLKDNGHAYKVGDVFPHDGRKIATTRILELSSNNNRQGTPLIEAVPESNKSKEAVLDNDVEGIKKTEVVADEVEPKEEPQKRHVRKKNS